jgi:hypothetical protein
VTSTGTLTTEDLVLSWDSIHPVEIAEFIRPEYSIVDHSTANATSCYGDTFPSPRGSGRSSTCEDMQEEGTSES